ncbi:MULTISPECIES: hypothetical protein [Hymenobacter]|uniref:Uncharacterized protein n=1 Tax=Hymenobacter lapidiphilus TaxID=2608003 RepID=A0A7Y7PSW6_9BACT|nr:MULTISPECIES: hypothetical protein [Hymenobacter]NVO33077.1 hypothetical protein [Hymenobacter lapidiphilus]
MHFLVAWVLHQIRTDGCVIRNHHVFPLEEVTIPVENTPDEQIYCAWHQLDAIRFSFEMGALKHYYVRRLLDDTQKRRIGCVDGLVTLLFNPGLRSYLFSVAQLDEIVPTSRPFPQRADASMAPSCRNRW